jgi:hypothetical protein
MTVQREEHETASDEISLRVYFETIWRYRQVIGVSLALVCVLYACAVLAYRIKSPEERVASVQFRLLFEGAAQDQYPNGIPFSPTDIAGAPVVTEVFKANDLQRFGSYEYFKQALYVQQASPELYNLASEYQAKLADTRISRLNARGLKKNSRTSARRSSIRSSCSACGAASALRSCLTRSCRKCSATSCPRGPNRRTYERAPCDTRCLFFRARFSHAITSGTTTIW